jgi:hypothetical protein
VTGYGLKDRGSTPGRDRDSYLRHQIHIGSGEHPVSYKVSNGKSSPGGKATERETSNFHTVPMLRIREPIPPLSHTYVFMMQYLIKHGHNCAFVPYRASLLKRIYPLLILFR